MWLRGIGRGWAALVLLAFAPHYAAGLGIQDSQQEGYSPAEYAPKVGDAHPDFVLPDIERRAPIRLSDYRGKKVILAHFASW